MRREKTGPQGAPGAGVTTATTSGADASDYQGSTPLAGYPLPVGGDYVIFTTLTVHDVRIVRGVSQPPTSPYPPDLADATPGRVDFGDLVDVAAAGLDWAGRRALGLSLRRVELRRCRLTGAELAEATLGDVTFDECRADLVGLRHATLERVVFHDCRMRECDLSGATLKHVLFERCDLREATFSAARLQRVELRACELTGIRGAEALRGARMPWNDVLQNATLFASLAGIEIVTDDE